MNGLALCAGVAGLELGLSLVLPRYRAVVYVEREAFAAARLVARMDEGVLDVAPVWDDVATFDGRPWRGVVDCVTGGFPCQPWSAAGKGGGVDDERWIWPDIRDRIREVEPRFVFLENVPPLVSRGGLALVLGDLAELGFDAEWDLFAAADVGASHRRERVFILAHRHGCGRTQFGSPDDENWRDASRDDADGRGQELADTLGAGFPPSEQQGESGPSIRKARDRRRAVAELRGTRVGNAEGRRLRELREPRRCDARRLVDRSDAHVADASDRFVARPERRAGRRGGARSASARLLADACGDAVRLQPERDPRERRRARAPERKYALPRADVPLFPPAPWDVADWRRVLAERPELAPALAMEHAAWLREHRSSSPDWWRWRRVPQAGDELANAAGARQPDRSGASIEERLADTGSEHAGIVSRRLEGRGDAWRQSEVERELRRVVDGLADRVDRLRACGNGVVPLAAAYAFLVLAARLEIWPAVAVEP